MTNTTEETSGKKLELKVGEEITNTKCIILKYAGKENNEDIFITPTIDIDTGRKTIDIHNLICFDKNGVIKTNQINEYYEGTDEFKRYLDLAGGYNIDGFRVGELK